jgi:hypothetical protein
MLCRIERLELFDELEEWHLIQEHYCFLVAVKEPAGLASDAAECTINNGADSSASPSPVPLQLRHLVASLAGGSRAD